MKNVSGFWTPSGFVTLFDASLLTFEPQILRLFFLVAALPEPKSLRDSSPCKPMASEPCLTALRLTERQRPVGDKWRYPCEDFGATGYLCQIGTVPAHIRVSCVHGRLQPIVRRPLREDLRVLRRLPGHVP